MFTAVGGGAQKRGEKDFWRWSVVSVGGARYEREQSPSVSGALAWGKSESWCWGRITSELEEFELIRGSPRRLRGGVAVLWDRIIVFLPWFMQLNVYHIRMRLQEIQLRGLRIREGKRRRMRRQRYSNTHYSLYRTHKPPFLLWNTCTHTEKVKIEYMNLLFHS